jgi:TonB family protein
LKRVKQIFFCLVLLASGFAVADQADRKLLHREDAVYPEIAQKMALHGSVKIKVWISPDGSVKRVEYIGGHPLLAESALKAVKTWKYEPADKETNQVVEVKF